MNDILKQSVCSTSLGIYLISLLVFLSHTCLLGVGMIRKVILVETEGGGEELMISLCS